MSDFNKYEKANLLYEFYCDTLDIDEIIVLTKMLKRQELDYDIFHNPDKIEKDFNEYLNKKML